MKKKLYLLILIIAIFISGCSGDRSGYIKYSYEFLGAFDTVVQFIGYAKTRDEFEKMAEIVEKRFLELHKLYDIYNDYEGINNVKTINDNAGIKPVEVSREIIDLILFSKEWYNKTNKKCNIAMGAVLSIWHDYREEGINDPENAKVPPLDILRRHTNIPIRKR